MINMLIAIIAYEHMDRHITIVSLYTVYCIYLRHE